MTEGEAGLAAFFLVSAALCAMGAAKALDTADGIRQAANEYCPKYLSAVPAR